ncbi:NDP-hexose 2,3-dehydratase family protein [Micromonospora sp. WMMD882]|uniref:NDP-hexose 2,3-dehydratase family protein n=1 Tax=Micromonospora sp. WMMD882 TaxID=3015151 RepID=UPI00248AC250|nr:NDP-hexose 2,3-dehydratase family protein [Micromonospora sp. WMMD882]WBB78711.1 NDP-hexose 2,3-dehydratase family protein [Micromonospora sp. WMMD882]
MSAGPPVTAGPSEVRLRPREDADLPARFARSAAVRDTGAGLTTGRFHDWLDERRRAGRFSVTPIPFDQLDGWSFAPDTGNLRHRSGRFFTVEGLHVTVDSGPYRDWQQPIIVQPEVGILGILAKEFDGVLHFLMQAKMEPGNPNLLQLSPTVQATRSNYTRVHQGAEVKYLEYFTDRSRARVLVDVLQSEHGSWFFHKANRNMIVETDQPVPLDDDFCWLTLGQLGELLRLDNVVNMDSRTVLACAPAGHPGHDGLLTDTELLSWFTAERSRHDVTSRLVPLGGIRDWIRGPSSIDHVRNWYFRVMAVAVQAGNREVPAWTQPLFQPIGTGVVALVLRRFAGVPHVLVHARVEGGFLDTVELGPTVQLTPAHHEHLRGPDRPAFLDLALRPDPTAIRYDAVHAEEGGRFHHAQSRYLIVEAGPEQAPTRPPAGFAWVTPAQLNLLVRHGRYVNVQARTLLSILNTRAAELL